MDAYKSTHNTATHNTATHNTATVFRFKFSTDFTEELYVFAQLHRFVDRHAFKEAWENWSEENQDIINIEIANLKNIGYGGDIIDKMYKSARYYLRKKSINEQKESQLKESQQQPRRKYISIDSELIKCMDIHILEWCRKADFRPANAFSNFCETHISQLEMEVLRLYSKEYLSKDDIPSKLKKTYKNRYFQKVKAPSLNLTPAVCS
jgi:hypothetical protein